jgi:hypothetical protein
MALSSGLLKRKALEERRKVAKSEESPMARQRKLKKTERSGKSG